MIIAKPNGALVVAFSSPFSNDRSRSAVQNRAIVQVRRLLVYAETFVYVQLEWMDFDRGWKIIIKKKKKGGRIEAIYTRWPRIDLKKFNSKLFETRFLIHGYVTYIYIYIFTGFNFIAYVSSTTTFLFQIHSSIPFHSSFPPEILDLIRNLEIAIEKAIRD